MKNKDLLPPDKNLELCKGSCTGCGKKCPLKNSCTRYNTEPLQLQKWLLHPPYNKKEDKCNFYKEMR